MLVAKNAKNIPTAKTCTCMSTLTCTHTCIQTESGHAAQIPHSLDGKLSSSFLDFRDLHTQHLTLSYISTQHRESTLGSLPSSILAKFKMSIIFANLLCLSQPRKEGLYVSAQSKPLGVENPATPGIMLIHIYSFMHPEAPKGNRVISAASWLTYSPLEGPTTKAENHRPYVLQ